MDKKIRSKLGFFCLVLILVLVIVYSGLRILESTVLYQRPMEVTVKKTVERDGVRYFPRQDINVILLMGINQEGPVRQQEVNQGLAADMVALLVFDEKEENCRILNINRDTMVDMPMLTESGREAGTFYGQLGYSHGYGTGMEDSCENTRKTVSNLLYGIHIDYYISMNIGAVPILNDAVGGVTVNVVDDFSAVDPTITKGTVTLSGEQARTFVRTRWDVGDALNLSRIRRQMEYMNSFARTFRSGMDADEDFVLETYNSVAPYILSDLPIKTLTGLISRYQDYEIVELASLEGENRLGETYYEFYPDEDKLEELILRMFYTAK